MIYTSTELFNAFAEDTRQIMVRVKINGAVFDNDNISTLNLEYGSMDGANFSLGSTFASSLKITFAELVEGLAELDEIEVEMGAVLPNGAIEYVPMGTFIINEEVMMDRNNNTTSIDALDRMVMLGNIYKSTLPGETARIIDIAVDIANQAGVVVSNDFDRLRTDSIQIPREKTLREAIGIIAQFEVGFATFNRDGELDIRRLNDPDFDISPEGYTLKGLVKNEVPFRLNGVQCQIGDSEEDVLQTGASTGTQIVLNNPSMTQAHLDRIYTELSTLNYYPFSLDWYGHPALEAGDWIEIEDLQGNKIKTPNLHYTLDFNGGLKAKSQAETTSSSEVVYQYKSPLKQEIQAIAARLSASGGNHVYDDLTPPTNPKEGDLWFKPEGPDTIILIYKRLEDGSLDWVEELNTGDTTKNAREIEAAIEEIEEAKRQAVASKQEAIDEAERLVTEQDTIYQELFDDYDAAVDDLTQGVAAADGKASDALTQAGESQSLAQSATEGVERVERTLTAVSNKADDAFSKADNALIKANNIPSTIDGVITDKGLVSGDWVTTKINEETGEINYALESVRGDVPDVVMGVTWDKEESPILTRTDYVEEFANLNDYELQSAEFRLSVEGLGMDLADVQRDKLDSSVFTTFKTNEYTNDIDGIRQRLTSAEENKLDGNTFQTFKEHDYQVTVAGLSGNIEKLEREKLDGDEFTNFKSNEYQLTVDGFEMALTDVSGAVPNLVLGVEWNRTESPRMERTDYTKELDLTNYAAPDYVLGVEWDRKENPLMVRTHDTQESTSKEEFELFLADYSFRADGWDATNAYITENSTSINSLINNAQGWSQTISYVDENQTKFNDTVSQVDFYKQTIGSDAENLAQLVMTDEAFVTRVGQLEGMTEDIILGVEWDKSENPTLTRTGYMDNWTETQVAQLADSWSMNLKSGGDIKTAINATEDGLRLLGKNIILDGNTLVTGDFAVSGKHVILDADTQVRGDFTVSGSNVILNAQTTVMGDFKVLGGNVTLDGDTTVHGDFSVFGKNIILDGDTTVQGTFKVTDTMIAANAEIDGAKIADATIGSAKIASLDVSKISGDKASFVQTAWNSINSRAHMDANRLRFTHADGSSTQIGVNGLERLEGGASRPYHYRTHIGEGETNGDLLLKGVTVTLPSDFKNKDFTVIFSLTGWNGVSLDAGVHMDVNQVRIDGVTPNKALGNFKVTGNGHSTPYAIRHVLVSMGTDQGKHIRVRQVVDYSSLSDVRNAFKAVKIKYSYVAIY